MMSIFPFAVAFLEVGASLVYSYNRKWAQALIWFCYAIATFALGTIRVDTK